MSESLVTNPIGWAQVRLLGGWGRIMTIAGVYAGAVLLFHILVYRSIQPKMPLSAFAGSALIIMIVVESAILFVVGSNAIRRTIHRDFTTDMIASHRITAMTGQTAVLGYLTGGNAQVLVLTVVNWIACTILALLAGPAQPPLAPTAVFIVLGCLALLCWTFAVLVALSTKGATSIVGLMVILFILANLGVVQLLPGLSLLLATTTITDLRSAVAGGITDASIFVSVSAQLAFSLTLFLAAARKFTRDDVPAFNPPLAYAMLALSSLVVAVGLRFWRATASPILPTVFTDLQMQMIATLAALALVACLPVAHAARTSANWKIRTAKDPSVRLPRPAPYLAAPLAATILVLAILATVLAPKLSEIFGPAGQNGFWRPALWTPVVFLLALVPVAGLLRFIYAAGRNKSIWIGALFLFLFWAVPLFVDLALGFIQDRDPQQPLSAVFGCSPIGMWIIVLKNVDVPMTPGLLFQAVVAAALVGLASRARHVPALRTVGGREKPKAHG